MREEVRYSTLEGQLCLEYCRKEYLVDSCTDTFSGALELDPPLRYESLTGTPGVFSEAVSQNDRTWSNAARKREVQAFMTIKESLSVFAKNWKRMVAPYENYSVGHGKFDASGICTCDTRQEARTVTALGHTPTCLVVHATA